jgi:hypothetical protein
MDKLADWRARVSVLDARLQPIAQRSVDIRDPDWFTKLRRGPDPLDELGVRSETEALLQEVIQLYFEGDDATRQAIRKLFFQNPSFSWAAKLSFPPTTPEGFRSHLLLFSINDQGCDSRDAVLVLQDLCKDASSAGVDTAAVLREVAALCSDQDKYGMGSTRSLLLKRAERGNLAAAEEPHGLRLFPQKRSVQDE